MIVQVIVPLVGVLPLLMESSLLRCLLSCSEVTGVKMKQAYRDIINKHL